MKDNLKNSDRKYYEALATFQLGLKDNEVLNENEFDNYLSKYRPHDKSNDLIMLGFFRHLTLIKSKARDYLSANLKIPEGVQSNWIVKFQESLSGFWDEPSMDSAKSLEIIRGNSNKNSMPSVETSVINRIRDNLHKYKQDSSGSESLERTIDVDIYERVVLEYVKDVFISILDTQITPNSNDKRVVGSLTSDLNKLLESKTSKIPIINKTIIDEAGFKKEYAALISKAFEKCFDEELVSEIRQDLITTANSKIDNTSTSVIPKLPVSVERQIAQLVDRNELIEVSGNNSSERYFISELELIDYYVTAKIGRSYPKYSDFLKALILHKSAEVVMDQDDSRYISFPMEDGNG